MAATVRISDSGRALLAQLAREAGTSMTDVLDNALESYRRQCFLARAAAAYQALSDEDLRDYRQEMASQEAANADGLGGYAP